MYVSYFNDYCSNFSNFQTSEYGNCYTIESDRFTTRRTGPLYGKFTNEKHLTPYTIGTVASSADL